MFGLFKRKLGKKLQIGDTVIVSKEGGWKENYTGTVVGPAGDNGLQSTKLGMVYIYWIRFDDDAYDIDGDGPYSKSEVLGLYLSKAS